MRTIDINHQPSGGKEWIAKINGTSARYGLEREFISRSAIDWSSSGKTGRTFYELKDGLHEINEPWKGRRFVIVDGETVTEVSTDRALAIAKGEDRIEKNYDRAAIMRRAWQIARIAVRNFGGSSRQYIAEAMRTAWAEAKNN